MLRSGGLEARRIIADTLQPGIIGEHAGASELVAREILEALPDPGGAVRLMKCTLFEDTSWVCEDHPDTPWEGEHACGCGGAGMPCPKCNPSDLEHPPRPPAGMRIQFDKRGWRH